MTAGVGADIVIETAGAPVAFKESLDLVRRGGIVVEVGHFTDPGAVEIHPHIVCFKDLDIRGMWAYPSMQFKTALSFLRNTSRALGSLYHASATAVRHPRGPRHYRW